MSFPAYLSDIPHISKSHMRLADKQAEEKFGITMAMTVEHAGRQLARVVSDDMCESCGEDIVIMVGVGYNGAGSIIAGRLLAQWGHPVHIILSHDEKRLKVLAQTHLDLAERAGVPVTTWEDFDLQHAPTHTIDGLVGYNIAGPLRGPSVDMAHWMNHSDARIISFDLPSGLDPDEGPSEDTIVRANKTVTLALPKIGLQKKNARVFTGRIYLADIGIPAQAYEKFADVPSDLFRESDIVEISQ